MQRPIYTSVAIKRDLYNDINELSSIALKREDYENISKLSKKIIRGVNLTIPQTIKYLVKDGLTRNQITKKDLTFNENGRDSK